MSDLSSKICSACRGDEPSLKSEEIEEKMGEIHDDWELVDDHHIERTFDFDDFEEALAFVNKVGEVAEEQGHHPVIEFTWGRATVKYYTHKIDGLHENDFIMAAKTDQIYLK